MATKFITISVDILRDKNLTPTQKFILAEIHQLTSLKDGCFAKNEHFAELVGISKTGASNAILDLEKKGYILLDYSESIRNNGRIIRVHHSGEGVHHSGEGVHHSGESKDNKTINIQINKKINKKEKFLNLLNEIFKDKKILTFKAKINLTEKSKIDKSSDLEKIAHDYADYVARNENKAVRLDKYLLAYAEGRLEAIEYADDKQPKKSTFDLSGIDYSTTEEF